jgi:hypothetical protein
MSLAMYAAPFDNDINIVNKDDTPIGRKRANNRTQKRMPSPKENNYSEKVNSVLQTIHNLPSDDDQLGDFTPIPPPTSVGVEQTKMRENTQPSGFIGQPSNNGKPQFLNEEGGDTSLYSGEDTPTLDSYKRFMPNYGEMYNSSSQYPSSTATNYSMMNQNYGGLSGDKNDVLIEKLNYMISLLEDQQDERTGSVTEEVILYSFLGIFIIFVVDSFARVGKYIR